MKRADGNFLSYSLVTFPKGRKFERKCERKNENESKKKSSCLLLHALGDCYIHRSVVEKTGRFLNLVKYIIFLNKYNLAKKDLKRQFSQLPRSKKKNIHRKENFVYQLK